MMFTNSMPERDMCSPGSAGAHSRTAGSEGNNVEQGWDNWQGTPSHTKGSQQAMPEKETFPKFSLLLYLLAMSSMINS